MRTQLLVLVASACCAAAYGQIVDDFNRPNSTDMGPNWSEDKPDFYIEDNQAKAVGSNIYMTWKGTPNTVPYYHFVCQWDVFAPTGSLAYTGLRTGVGGTYEMMIKLQSQSSPGTFSHIGFYRGKTPGLYSAWPGGKGFVTLTAKFDKGRITQYFKQGNKDEVFIDIDTDFNGTPEYTYSSPGVEAWGNEMGLGLGIAAYGSPTSVAVFDNLFTPEPTSLASLALGMLLRRR
jgi:hypothetical protein